MPWNFGSSLVAPISTLTKGCHDKKTLRRKFTSCVVEYVRMSALSLRNTSQSPDWTLSLTTAGQSVADAVHLQGGNCTHSTNGQCVVRYHGNIVERKRSRVQYPYEERGVCQPRARYGPRCPTYRVPIQPQRCRHYAKMLTGSSAQAAYYSNCYGFLRNRSRLQWHMTMAARIASLSP